MNTFFKVVALTGLVLATMTGASSALTEPMLLGTWKDKSGPATYAFEGDHNFEYREGGTVEKGIWKLAPVNCGFQDAKGNLYIQASTHRCCHQAYVLGENLVLSTVVQPTFTGVCSDRVLTKALVQPGP